MLFKHLIVSYLFIVEPENEANTFNQSLINFAVLQSVADSQPDVDAIFRLTRKTPFSFRRPTCIKKGCID